MWLLDDLSGFCNTILAATWSWVLQRERDVGWITVDITWKTFLDWTTTGSFSVLSEKQNQRYCRLDIIVGCSGKGEFVLLFVCLFVWLILLPRIKQSRQSILSRASRILIAFSADWSVGKTADEKCCLIYLFFKQALVILFYACGVETHFVTNLVFNQMLL